MHCVGLQPSLLTASFFPLTLKTWNKKEHIYDTAITFLLKALGKRINYFKWSRRAPRQNLVVRICWYGKKKKSYLWKLFNPHELVILPEIFPMYLRFKQTTSTGNSVKLKANKNKTS